MTAAGGLMVLFDSGLRVSLFRCPTVATVLTGFLGRAGDQGGRKL